jgi:hypothetical protein
MNGNLYLRKHNGNGIERGNSSSRGRDSVGGVKEAGAELGVNGARTNSLFFYTQYVHYREEILALANNPC